MTTIAALADHPLLALDTSGSVGSVAVRAPGGRVATILLGRRKEHAARLVPAIGDALTEAGVTRAELAGVLVGEGPGSFTGVRIAASTAKGLVRALSIPLFAVSSLVARAAASERDGGRVLYVLLDARADRVYAACYGVGAVGVETLVAPRAAVLRDVLASDVPPGALFVGDGADRHRGAIEGAGFPVAGVGGAASLAEGLLVYASLVPTLEAVSSPGTWEPAYLRDSGAVPA